MDGERQAEMADQNGFVMPSDDEIRAMFAEARREQAFWEEHYPRLVQEHPDRFIAVREGKVIAVGNDPYELADAIRAAGFEPGQVWPKFMMATPIRYIL
jgi:hypothetical protein